MKLFGRRQLPQRLGAIVLAVWLVSWGLLQLRVFNIPGGDAQTWVMALLAIAAGVLIFLDR
jgi:hypothetical protein